MSVDYPHYKPIVDFDEGEWLTNKTLYKEKGDKMVARLLEELIAAEMFSEDELIRYLDDVNLSAITIQKPRQAFEEFDPATTKFIQKKVIGGKINGLIIDVWPDGNHRGDYNHYSLNNEQADVIYGILLKLIKKRDKALKAREKNLPKAKLLLKP